MCPSMKYGSVKTSGESWRFFIVYQHAAEAQHTIYGINSFLGRTMVVVHILETFILEVVSIAEKG